MSLIPLNQMEERNPVIVYTASLSEGSRRTVIGSMKTIAGLLGIDNPLLVDWSQFRFEHMVFIRSQLAEVYKPNTANKMLNILKSVLRTAKSLGVISAEEYANITDVRTIKGETELAGRDIEDYEIDALLQVCYDDPTPAGYRDAAIIALMRVTGMRRSSVVKLNVASLESGKVLVEKAKGNKSSWLPVGEAESILLDWLQVRGYEDGPLFVDINKSGNSTYRRLTDQAIYYILQQRGKQAGLEHFTAHDLRRTLAGDLIAIDVSVAQQMLMHSKVETTLKYDRRGDKAKEAAVNTIKILQRSE